MSDIKEKTLKLIDGLKATCQSYGMGNDGNEYKIITQVFLYKFLNDKFGYELKNAKSEIAKKLTGDVKWETAYETLSDDERMLIQSAISPDVPMLEPYHLIANLWNQQGKGDFDTIFDSTMTDIAELNADILHADHCQHEDSIVRGTDTVCDRFGTTCAIRSCSGG